MTGQREPLRLTADELQLALSTITQWRGYPFRRTVRHVGLATPEQLNDLRARIFAERDRLRSEHPASSPELHLSEAERLLLVAMFGGFLEELRARGEVGLALEFELVMGQPLEAGLAFRDRLCEP